MKIKSPTTPVCAKAQDEKMSWITTNLTMGVIFNIQNSQLLTQSLPKEDVFQGHSQNRPVANLPVFNFRSQPQKMSLSNHWMSKFRFFLFEFWFSSPSRKFISWKTDVSAAEWRYQIQAKNYRIFSRALLWLFSGPKIFLQHRSLIW